MSILYPKNYSLGLPDAHAFPKVQYAKIVEMIDAINKIIAGTITITDIELGNGTVSAPSLTFASDLDTGIYRIGANNIGIAVNATKILDIGTGGLTLTGFSRTSAGTVGAPAFSFGSQTDQGMYNVSSTQLGFAVGGTLVGGFNASGIFTNTITEQTTGAGVTLAKNIIRQNTLTALNATGTITAAMVQKGGITSTSAAAVTATLDTAANIGAAIGATNGTTIEFIVDNTAGANTVTVAVATGITAATPVVTGGATLTVSTANAIGIFRLVFSDASTAKLYRIG